MAGWLLARAPDAYVAGIRAIAETRLFLDDSYFMQTFTMASPRERSRCAGLTEYLDAFWRASQGEAPPLSYLLLAHGNEKWWQDDRRGAVIDAANGAEVALSRGISRRLTREGASWASAQAALGSAEGLAALLHLYGDLGGAVGVSRGRVLSRLAGPRNRAVHAGQVPDAEDARAALDVARQVVESADPLPPVRSSHRLPARLVVVERTADTAG